MKALIAVISDLSTDMRVWKQASLLAEMGFDVNLIGRKGDAAQYMNLPHANAVRLRVPFRRGPLMYLSYNMMLMLQLLFRRADIYVANDLDTLLPCFIASRLYSKPLVYDAHEYFTGQYGLSERRFKYLAWKRLEKLILPRVRHMMTVSLSIASLYREEYGVNPSVIRNVAPSTDHIMPVKRHDIVNCEGDLLVIFQGAGINPGRGSDELIDAMASLDGVILLIIGSGDIIADIRQKVSDRGLDDRVKFLPRMPWNKMMGYTMSCDAGLSLDTDTCLNQRFSLPNKLFDYIAAGIPVVVTPLPEVSAVVSRYKCGIILSEMTPEAIRETLTRLRDDRLLLKSLKEGAAGARKELTWETEKQKEQDLFKSVIKTKEKR
ncbi:MAG: glycosyltransferase [Bacteroidales bacterium]|nr:glycosyltransferase [Bacteroidales bacterium]